MILLIIDFISFLIKHLKNQIFNIHLTNIINTLYQKNVGFTTVLAFGLWSQDGFDHAPLFHVFPYLHDVTFFSQGKIGKKRLAEKRTIYYLITLSQGRRTVRASAVEIVQC
jgi:hypothetical protein